jgi:hypothetical protein
MFPKIAKILRAVLSSGHEMEFLYVFAKKILKGPSEQVR